MKGRKAQPAHLKALRGNTGHRPIRADEPTPPSAPFAPACPEWIGEHGQALWAQQAPISHALGTLTQADVPAFTAWCEAWDTYRRAVEALAEDLTHETPNNGCSVRPEVTVRKQALADWTRIGAELGYSPASRTRIKATPPNAHSDPVTDFARQRPARPA